MLEVRENCKAYLEDVKAFARRTGQHDRLQEKLVYLIRYGGKDSDGNDKFKVVLDKDFAPYSFSLLWYLRAKDGSWEFCMEGGMIYHGPHDGHGSGATPALAVTLQPTDGWSIHT